MKKEKKLLLILSLITTILIFLSVKNFIFYDGKYIDVVALAEKNINSFGTEVLINNISINNEMYDLSTLKNSDWILKDNVLFFVGNNTGILHIEVPRNSKISINFSKYSYGGKARINTQNSSKEFDFYSENVNTISYSYDNYSNTFCIQSILYLVCLFIYVSLFIYFLEKYPKYSGLFFVGLSFLLILIFRITNIHYILFLLWGLILCIFLFFKKNKNIYSLIIPLNIFLLLKYLFVNLNFHITAASQMIPYILTNILTLFAIYAIFGFVEKSYIKIFREKNNKYKNWLILSSIVFIINYIFLIFIWPGNWIWDEKGILLLAQNYIYGSWQSYLSVLFYAISLRLIPFLVGIEIAQITIISLITGYIFNEIFYRLRIKKYIIILFCLFLLPPILLNNLYPLRSSICAYLEVLLIFKIFIICREKKLLSIHEIISISLLTITVSFWRSENIYYLVVIPLLMIFLMYKQLIVEKRIYQFICCFLVIILLAFPLLYLKNKNNLTLYELTVYVNPLSNMFINDYKIDNIDYNNINKVLNIDVLKQYNAYNECPAFQHNVLQNNYESNMKNFKKSYINFVLDNPTLFFKVRLKTFFASTGMNKEYINNSPWGIYENYQRTSDKEILNMINNDSLSKPINYNFRNNVIHLLKGTVSTNSYEMSFLGQIIWNFLPSILIIIIFIIYMLIFKKDMIGILLLCPLIKIPLIFITAPANYFFYYFTVYIFGILLLGYVIINLLELRSVKNEKK